MLRVDEDEEEDVGVGNASCNISSLADAWNVERVLLVGEDTPGERSLS